MAKTAYFTDQDFERFMALSEWKLKIQFYVCLVCSMIAQSGIWYVLLTDKNVGGSSYAILVAFSVAALLCLGGLGYCYFSVRYARKKYLEIKRQQQDEMNALLDEVETARHKKLNAD